MEMIQRQLKQIEQERNVKILFATLVGSRAYGLDSKNSDYDVRFIYIHPMDWYLSIERIGDINRNDVIELPISDTLDISGWEMTKALRLFRKSNPSIYEWLSSEIVYLDLYHFKQQLHEIQKAYFQPKSMLHHYVNIARKNYQKVLQKHNVNIKSYLYILRSLFACKWIEQYGEVPPIQFWRLMNGVELNKELTDAVELLLEKKKSEQKNVITPSNPKLNKYIVDQIQAIDEYIERMDDKQEKSFEPLNLLFRKTLEEVWG